MWLYNPLDSVESLIEALAELETRKGNVKTELDDSVKAHSKAFITYVRVEKR